MREKNSCYPKHAFPIILKHTPEYSADLPLRYQEDRVDLKKITLTKYEKKILSILKMGKRILFDMNLRKTFIVTWQRGVQILGKMTLRTMSKFIQMGILSCHSKEGHLVHLYPKKTIYQIG